MPENMSLKAFADNYNEFLIRKSSSLSMTEGGDPDGKGSAGSVMSKFSRDNPLVLTRSQHQLVEKLDQFLSDFKRVGIAQGTVGEQEACHTRERFQVRQHMQNPCVVGVALRRSLVVGPTRIRAQIVVVPALEVKGRIGHDVVEV